MDLRQLRYFLAVAEAGSFTAAARAVPVSQPALSLAVRQLERELGADLFARLGRRISLTPAGDALLAPARQTLRDAEGARTAVAEVAGLVAGHLTLGALPTLAPDPLAPLVGAFRSRFPAVVVELAAPEDSAELVQLLTSGRCELGIDEAATPWTAAAGLEELPLGRQELWLVFPPGTSPSSLAAADGTVPLARLSETPFVATPEGTSSRRLLDEGFASAGCRPTVAAVAAQRDAVVPLVLAGAGAALVPEAVATMAEVLGAPRRRPRPAVIRHTALLHRRGTLTPAARRMVEMAGLGDEGALLRA